MSRHLKSCAIGVSFLPFLAMPTLGASALPGGGNFVSGSGHISSNPAATQLTVNQTSKNGIINWGSFSIGAGNGVQINNGSGATLNRVIGNSLSKIEGSLNATGSAYLINQNGIIITPTGQVVTGGDFVASTRDTTDPAFGGGDLHLSGNSGAPIKNHGMISAGGTAVLIGDSPVNSGTINAPNGIAALVAGDDVTLQPGPAGLQIHVTTGSGDVTNSGTIAAAQVMLNAVGGNVYALAGNNSAISATGTANINGHVWLTAGGNITVGSSGTASSGVRSNGPVSIAANDAGKGGSVDIEAPITAQTGSIVIGGGDDPAQGAAVGTPAQPVGVIINGAVTANSGDIKIDGAGYAGATANSAYGVEIGGMLLASGAISVAGTGGNNGAPNQTYNSSNPLDPCVPGICNYGVYINSGAVVSMAVAPVTITGAGGGSGGTSFGNDGVFIFNGLVQGSGAISISGIGGSTTGPNNFGVTNEGAIIDTGSGNIMLTGTSGANGPGAEVSPLGLGQVGVANLGIVSGQIGNISITGKVGANASGIGNVGIGLASGGPGLGVVTTGGNGKITLNGIANGQGHDAGVDFVNFGGLGSPTVETVDGEIKIKGAVSPAGAAANEAGVSITDGTIETLGNGDVSIIGNVSPDKAVAVSTNAGVTIGGDTSAPAPTASVVSGDRLTIRSKGNVALLPGGSLTANGTGNALIIGTDTGQFSNQGGTYSAPNGHVEIRSDDEEHDSGDDGSYEGHDRGDDGGRHSVPGQSD